MNGIHFLLLYRLGGSLVVAHSVHLGSRKPFPRTCFIAASIPLIHTVEVNIAFDCM